MIVVLPLVHDRFDDHAQEQIGVNPEFVKRVEPYREDKMTRVVVAPETYYCVDLSFDETVSALNKGKK